MPGLATRLATRPPERSGRNVGPAGVAPAADMTDRPWPARSAGRDHPDQEWS
jgi:hypothetical protein